MSPCSRSSSRTARLLWTRTRSGRSPPSHRPQSFCLAEEEVGERNKRGSGQAAKQGAFRELDPAPLSVPECRAGGRTLTFLHFNF